MKKYLLVTICLLQLAFAANAQFTWDWARCSVSDSVHPNSLAESICIASDKDGNVIIGGLYRGQAWFGPYLLPADSISKKPEDMFIAKYDALGNVLWARHARGTVQATSIATDVLGNVYVAGNFDEDSARFDSIIVQGTGGNTANVFVAKYDSVGNILWVRNPNGWYSSSTPAIAVDIAGNAYITGGFNGDSLSFGSTYIVANHTASTTFYLCKYGAAGNFDWAKTIISSAPVTGQCIGVDRNGDLRVAGVFAADTLNMTVETLFNTGIPGCQNFFIAKYDSSGNIIWAQSAASEANSSVNAISVDGDGNSYLTGLFSGDSILFGPVRLYNAGQLNVFIIKYNNQGKARWGKAANGGHRNIGYGIVAAGNELYAGGSFQDSIIFESSIIYNDQGDTSPTYILSLDTSGKLLCTGKIGTSDLSNQQLPAGIVCADAAGNAFTTGKYETNDFTVGNDSLHQTGWIDAFVTKFRCQLGNTEGIAEVISSGAMVIYPNPTSNVVNITVGENLIGGTLSIADLTGRKIIETKLAGAKNEFATAELSNGIYLVTVGENNVRYITRKLVVSK